MTDLIMVTLAILALVFGLASCGSLLLAVATDYWLYTREPIDFENMILGGAQDISHEEFPPVSLQGLPPQADQFMLNESIQIILPTTILIHSGLWRVCVYYEDEDGKFCVLLSFCVWPVRTAVHPKPVTKNCSECVGNTFWTDLFILLIDLLFTPVVLVSRWCIEVRVLSPNRLSVTVREYWLRSNVGASRRRRHHQLHPPWVP